MVGSMSHTQQLCSISSQTPGRPEIPQRHVPSSQMGQSGSPPPGPANTGRSSQGPCYPDEAEVPLPFQVP